MTNFSPLAAEICWRVWGTPANVSGYRVLAALLHGNLVVGISQTLHIEQRAPPIFDRAAITLGIGPHSSFKFLSTAKELYILMLLPTTTDMLLYLPEDLQNRSLVFTVTFMAFTNQCQVPRDHPRKICRIVVVFILCSQQLQHREITCSTVFPNKKIHRV